MDKCYEDILDSINNYALKRCCWIMPVRTGILLIGYVNSIVSVVLIVGTATQQGFTPVFTRVQMQVSEGDPYNSICVMVPCTELAFSVVLLCAMHRDDIKLLKFYMYYGLAAIVTSIFAYSVVVPVLGSLFIIAISANLVYQAYVIILVRSAIVEIRHRDAPVINGTVVIVKDVEAPASSEVIEKPEGHEADEVTLERVDETHGMDTVEESQRDHASH